jgi:hypothetical protein
VNEVCPSCGSFTDYLGEVTGWCHECESITGIVDAKACLGCGVVKALDDFPPHRRTLDGRRGKCRKCATAQRLAWRAANRERVWCQAAAVEAVVGVVRPVPGQG